MSSERTVAPLRLFMSMTAGLPPTIGSSAPVYTLLLARQPADVETP